jgi:hypothetical protein
METQTESTPAQKKPCCCSWRTRLLLLAVLAVLYGLSFGLAMRLEAEGHLKQHRRTSKALALFFSPIIFAHHHTPLKTPIEAYVKLWLPPSTKAK